MDEKGVQRDVGEQEEGSASLPFQVKDCALVSIATGIRAQTLREFREGLLGVPLASVYHHFWGRLLRPRFDEPEYNNDFASWAYHALHEKSLAERLSMVNPADFDDLEELRREVVEIVEQRLDETEFPPSSRADDQFHFLQARVVIFDTGVRLDAPRALARALPDLPTGSIYYHFIDARRRTPGRCDDFSTWLEGFGEDLAPLIADLAALDPYFSSLKEMRFLLTAMFQTHLGSSADV